MKKSLTIRITFRFVYFRRPRTTCSRHQPRNPVRRPRLHFGWHLGNKSLDKFEILNDLNLAISGKWQRNEHIWRKCRRHWSHEDRITACHHLGFSNHDDPGCIRQTGRSFHSCPGSSSRWNVFDHVWNDHSFWVKSNLISSNFRFNFKIFPEFLRFSMLT